MTRAGPSWRGRKAASPMQLDPLRYSHRLSGSGCTSEDQMRLMQHIWAMMDSACASAWGEAPEQMLRADAHQSCIGSRNSVQSTRSLTTTFNDAAQETRARKQTP